MIRKQVLERRLEARQTYDESVRNEIFGVCANFVPFWTRETKTPGLDLNKTKYRVNTFRSRCRGSSSVSGSGVQAWD